MSTPLSLPRRSARASPTPMLLALALIFGCAAAQSMNHDAASHTAGYVWDRTPVRGESRHSLAVMMMS